MICLLLRDSACGRRLTDAQIARLRPFFPRSHGKPRVDDRRVPSGMIFIHRHGLRWCDTPKEYGPAKTLHHRWKRWGDNGVLARIMMGPAAESAESKTIMIDATYLKAHRTASSLRAKTGGAGGRSGAVRGSENDPRDRFPENGRQDHPAARGRRCEGAADRVLHLRRSGKRLHRTAALARAACRRPTGFRRTGAAMQTGCERR